MRTGSFVASVVPCLALAACSPYSPDLTAQPFFCGSADPKCPDGFTCSGMDTDGHMLCTTNSGNVPDAPNNNAMCANDSATEGAGRNDTLATAYALPPSLPIVSGGMGSISFASLAICPMGDKDNYSIILTKQQTLEADIMYDNWGVALSGQILTTSGTPIVSMSPVSGETNSLRATVADLAAGEYIIQIFGPASGAGQNNYKLTVSLTPYP